MEYSDILTMLMLFTFRKELLFLALDNTVYGLSLISSRAASYHYFELIWQLLS